MKPLTSAEIKLKEEMKERCLAKGQYKDENSKAKFNMLCHLENFEIQYWELLQENKQLKEKLDKYENPEDMTLFTMWCTEKVKDENKQMKDNWDELKKYIHDFPNIGYSSLEKVNGARLSGKLIRVDYLLDKMQELEKGSGSNVKK